jgi:hypothetical protein
VLPSRRVADGTRLKGITGRRALRRALVNRTLRRGFKFRGWYDVLLIRMRFCWKITGLD